MQSLPIFDPTKLGSSILPADAYLLSPLEVAPFLLGKMLVRKIGNTYMGGLIKEAEAYMGEGDLGCHAKAGKTPRTGVMYGPPGRAYVYFTYGMHWMLNAVTCPENQPAAVLIRSILPQFGVDHMQKFRPFPPGKTNREKASDWTDGPAKLCQALNITREQNAVDLCSPDSGLYIADVGVKIPPIAISQSPRIGLNTVPEPWKSKPWRWLVDPDWRP
jgi:DNA-3-methyladenine glycosylase